MSVEANKQTVRAFFRHLESGALDDAFALLTPDATWWIPTDQPGGVALPKDVMRGGVADFYGVFAHQPEMTQLRMTAEDDRVCLEQISRNGRTHGGVSYGNDYHMLFQLRDGLICEVREYMNPVLAAGLMAEMQANREPAR